MSNPETKLTDDEREIAKLYNLTMQGASMFLTVPMRRALLAEEVLHAMTLTSAAGHKMDIEYYARMFTHLKATLGLMEGA